MPFLRVGLCIIAVGSALLSAEAGDCNDGNDRVYTLPNLNTAKNRVPTTQYAGYVMTNRSVDGHLFYWFTEAMNPVVDRTEIPILIWFNGGPGASSLNGLYFEQGMYRLNDDLTVDMKQASDTWSDKYHQLFWDNPVGVGYSHCAENGYATDMDQVGEQIARAVKGFYDCHQEYASNPLYVTGESYAGRYIPFAAKWMQKLGGFPLKGLAIGNGHLEPYIQIETVADYTYNLGIIDDNEYENTLARIHYALDVVAKYDERQATDSVMKAVTDLYADFGGGILQYDVRVSDGKAIANLGTALNAYSNLESVKSALHTVGHEFRSDGSHHNPVFEALKEDYVANGTMDVVRNLLDSGLPILFFNGQFDGSGCCNNIGNQRCLDQMNYGGHWMDAPKKPVHAVRGGPTIGYVKALQKPWNLLTYFVISNAGHLVPMDQPQNSKHMIETWIQGGYWS